MFLTVKIHLSEMSPSPPPMPISSYLKCQASNSELESM